MIKETKIKCEKLFLEFFKQFLTIEAIKFNYGVSDEKMLQALKIGRKVNSAKIQSNIDWLDIPW